MFMFHIAFSLGLIALSAGIALYVVCKKIPGSGLAKLVAFLIIIFSLLSTLCTSYYGFKYWQAGGHMQYMMMQMKEHNMMHEKEMPAGTMTPKVKHDKKMH